MSLLRRSQLFRRRRGGAGRIAAALLLAIGFAQAGGAPVMAASAATGPLAPASGCGVVVNTSDNAPGSLRWTVGCVAAGATVTFLPALAGQTIVLTGTEIALTQPITIDGSAAPGLIVDAGNTSRIFDITASGPVTLTALTLQHGTAAGDGGAVVDTAASALVLSGTQVLSSTAAGQGGGLWAADAVLTNTQFISNTSGSDAGGAWVQFGTASVTGGRFERNTCTGGGCQGGGLNVNFLTLSGTVLISNTSAGQGGGAWADSTASLSNATLQGNQCIQTGCQGGGLYTQGGLTLSGTEFGSNNSHGDGGGAYVQAAALLTNGQFQDNHCYRATGSCEGGGLYVAGSLALTGTSFISNTSLTHGGGIAAQSDATLTNGSFQGNHCTASGCLGGGLEVSATLTATNTDFTNNISTLYGGGAYALGAVLLTNGRFEGNHCTASDCQGGGLAVGGALTVTGTDFISNTSLLFGGGAAVGGAAALTNGRFQGNKCIGSACQGGGLAVGGALTVTGTDFIDNISVQLGGGAVAEGTAVLTHSRFQGNKCTGTTNACEGGGLAVILYSLTLTDTDFISNTSFSSGGGAAAGGLVALTRGRFVDNHCTDSHCVGGGLYVLKDSTLLGSSFSGNQAGGTGGAMGTDQTIRLTLANDTLAGNRATGAGGGLYAGGASTVSLYNVTVADNQGPGGGVYLDGGATAGVTNTLFSNNGAVTCFGTIVAGTHNLEFPGNTCATAGPGAGFSTADPQLAPLALNAPGTTLTQALLPGSPARDAGDPASCAAAPVNNLDQRGVTRPIRGLAGIGAAVCDIGAFEAGPPVWPLFLPLVSK